MASPRSPAHSRHLLFWEEVSATALVETAEYDSESLAGMRPRKCEHAWARKRSIISWRKQNCFSNSPCFEARPTMRYRSCARLAGNRKALFRSRRGEPLKNASSARCSTMKFNGGAEDCAMSFPHVNFVSNSRIFCHALLCGGSLRLPM